MSFEGWLALGELDWLVALRLASQTKQVLCLLPLSLFKEKCLWLSFISVIELSVSAFEKWLDI